MDLHMLGKMLGAALVPLFWLLILTLCKWAVRRWKPEWEKTLWAPMGSLVVRRPRPSRPERPIS
jgi:hypothetical protein